MANDDPILAGDVMRSPVHCADADAELFAEAERIAERGFSGVPVVDEEGALVGMLAEVDVVLALAVAAFHEHPPPLRVRDVMIAPPWPVRREADLFQLVSLFVRGHRRLVVVDDGRPVGIVARRDLTRALLALCEDRWRPRAPWARDAAALITGMTNPLWRPRYF